MHTADQRVDLVSGGPKRPRKVSTCANNRGSRRIGVSSQFAVYLWLGRCISIGLARF
jgi:hypothetical protein